MDGARAVTLGLSIAALAGACQEPSYGGPDYEVRPAATQLWSGARVAFYSQAFADHASPLFVFNDTTLLAVRVDDTTFTVPLPAVRGEITIDVQFRYPGDTVTVGPLTLYGFRDAHLGPALKGAPHVWPGGGVTSIIVAGEVGLVRYDLTHDLIAQRWPDSLHVSGCNYGPGVSFRPDHFVLQGPGCGALKSWRITGEPVLADSATGWYGSWALVEMSEGRWLRTVDDLFSVIECTEGVCTRRDEFGYHTEDAVLSPRGDRVALGGYHPLVADGPWVLDASTGNKAFSIPAMREAYAAAFSPEGDTIFVVGEAATGTSYGDLVLAVDATAGAILDSTTEGQSYAYATPWRAIALDPLADVLYVAGTSADGAPTLGVYRRSTLDLLTIQHAPLASLPSGLAVGPTGVEIGVIPAPLDGVVYMLYIPRIYDPPSSPIGVYRFDRLP